MSWQLVSVAFVEWLDFFCAEGVCNYGLVFKGKRERGGIE